MAVGRVGRYRLLRRIGRGGMGEVFLGQFEAMAGVRRLAAVKILKDYGTEPSEQRALVQEARLLAFLSHPNVVQMLDAGVDDGIPWLAMEFVGGTSMQEILAASSDRTGGPLPPWIVARMLADASLGLHAVHEARDDAGKPLEIVHRDVTPHNLLVRWDGIVKVTDFGVARSAVQSTVTRTGVLKGKLAFMSPEQAVGGAVDRRTDVFALGIVLWECLTGRRLFKGANEPETLAHVILCNVPPATSVRAGVPESLSRIADRALARDPSGRYDSALDMRRALEGAMREAHVDVGPGEVAEVVAGLLPERVREHEAWIREVNERAELPTEPDLGLAVAESQQSDGTVKTMTGPGSGLVARERGRAPLVALIVLVAVVAASAGVFGTRHFAGSAAGLAPELATSERAVPGVPPSAPASVAAGPPASASTPSPSASAPAPATSRIARPSTEESFGLLSVGSSPVWSQIRIDGRSVGPSPVVSLRVRAGYHSIEALPQGHGPAVRSGARVSAGGHARVVVNVPAP